MNPNPEHLLQTPAFQYLLRRTGENEPAGLHNCQLVRIGKGQPQIVQRCDDGAALGRARGKDAHDADLGGGIKPGDVITAVNGKPVKNVSQLLTAVASLKPGTPAPLTVLRGNGPVEIAVTPGKRERPKVQR